jgi:ribosomal protein S18 acetylase RimI-like enzyme
MTITIRAFHPQDLDSLIHLATLSFAEEYTASGMTADGFAQQIRMATKGRMIPLKITTALSGYKWEVFVAEVDDQVVGCGGYLGRQRMELVNLMVHPDYRRRGIGQALLEHRLERLATLGCSTVTTTILANNKASLGNVEKQGFEIFDRYTILETALPLPHPSGSRASALRSQSILSTDKSAFEKIETQTANPLWQQIEGSAGDRYFLRAGDRLMNRFNRTQSWVRVFRLEEETIGFLAAKTSEGQTKGSISRPVIADEHAQYLAEMLHETAVWLSEHGKTTLQIAVPNARPMLLDLLQEQGWQQIQSWVRLVKWLNR